MEADARLRASQIGSKIDSYVRLRTRPLPLTSCTSASLTHTSLQVDSAKAQGKDVQKQLEGLSADARKQVDSLSQDARKQYDNASTEMRARYNQAMSEGKKLESTMRSYASDAEANLEAARKEAAARMNSAVDSFDKNVTEGASKAKSGISSWFGGGK